MHNVYVINIIYIYNMIGGCLKYNDILSKIKSIGFEFESSSIINFFLYDEEKILQPLTPLKNNKNMYSIISEDENHQFKITTDFNNATINMVNNINNYDQNKTYNANNNDTLSTKFEYFIINNNMNTESSNIYLNINNNDEYYIAPCLDIYKCNCGGIKI